MSNDEFYLSHDTGRLVDDILVMFIAGMETIQISTTNVIQHLIEEPDMKKRLLDETEAVLLEAEKTNLVEGLTAEMVENFNFTRNCFYEALRMDAPTSVSGAASFSEDVKIGKVNFTKDIGFTLMIFLMHMDPDEWIFPKQFLPDRFDSNSEYYLRPDQTKRSPLTFNPFLGGKRVCLGKSFAEITVRHTLPLLYHFLNFEFAEANQKYTPLHMG